MPNVTFNCLSSKILVDILPQLPLLRVLSLSRLDIVEVPECVGNMKHLRYLNLSRTRITHLPENICYLYNLHTLIVSGCGNQLTKLPENFLKLKNLRHFDIRDTLLWNMMPLWISEMKSLHTLSNNIDVENNSFFIYWLRNLKNLQAEIYIGGLQKLQSAREIQEANLAEKRVSKLRMRWSNVFDDVRNEKLEKEVLDALKPHSDNLKDLVIESYGGKLFPNWIGDPSFLHLTSVWIGKCRNCMNLPPLGELPSLKKLDIQGLNEVKLVGSEFLGTGIAFPKLESLSFAHCPNLSEVSLEALEVSLEALPSLRDLHLYSCGDSVSTSLIHAASSVTKLRIICQDFDEVWRGVIVYLGVVEEVIIWDCKEIRYLWESEAEASKVLVNLRELHVEFCKDLKALQSTKHH